MLALKIVATVLAAMSGLAHSRDILKEMKKEGCSDCMRVGASISHSAVSGIIIWGIWA